MPTYRELVRNAEKAFAEKGIPESTALLYMLELSEKEVFVTVGAGDIDRFVGPIGEL